MLKGFFSLDPPFRTLRPVEIQIKAAGTAFLDGFKRNAAIDADGLQQTAPMEQFLHQPVPGRLLKAATAAEIGPDQWIDFRAEQSFC